jgi:ribosomal protein S27E
MRGVEDAVVMFKRLSQRVCSHRVVVDHGRHQATCHLCGATLGRRPRD